MGAEVLTATGGLLTRRPVVARASWPFAREVVLAIGAADVTPATSASLSAGSQPPGPRGYGRESRAKAGASGGAGRMSSWAEACVRRNNELGRIPR
jgi:hypothetical protein